METQAVSCEVALCRIQGYTENMLNLSIPEDAYKCWWRHGMMQPYRHIWHAHKWYKLVLTLVCGVSILDSAELFRTTYVHCFFVVTGCCATGLQANDLDAQAKTLYVGLHIRSISRNANHNAWVCVSFYAMCMLAHAYHAHHGAGRRLSESWIV